MSVEQYQNGGSTTLASNYTAGAGSISVTSAASFPSSGIFRVTILDSSGTTVKMIYRVTSVSGTTFTGAAEGADVNCSSGDVVVGTSITAGAIDQIRKDISQLGTLANRPASGKQGDIYRATDDRDYFHNGSAWQDASRRIMDGLRWEFDPPLASPSAYDDEFNATSLDASWTAVTNTANAVDYNTTWKSHVYLNFTGSTQHYQIKKSIAPGSAAFSVTMCVRLAASVGNCGAFIAVFDSSDNNGVGVYNVFTSAVTKFNHFRKVSGSSTFSIDEVTVPAANRVYLHIQRTNANVYSFWMSWDGLSWYRAANTDTQSFTVDHVILDINADSQTIPFRGGFDWFRYNWLTL